MKIKPVKNIFKHWIFVFQGEWTGQGGGEGRWESRKTVETNRPPVSLNTYFREPTPINFFAHINLRTKRATKTRGGEAWLPSTNQAKQPGGESDQQCSLSISSDNTSVELVSEINHLYSSSQRKLLSIDELKLQCNLSNSSELSSEGPPRTPRTSKDSKDPRDLQGPPRGLQGPPRTSEDSKDPQGPPRP